MDDTKTQLQTLAGKLNLDRLERHVFLCVGDNCCTSAAGLAAWEALKQGIKEAGLTTCYRTKVGCLRICCEGPTAVVYPEGTWYHGLDAERMPRFVQEHLVNDQPVNEWMFAQKKL